METNSKTYEERLVEIKKRKALFTYKEVRTRLLALGHVKGSSLGNIKKVLCDDNHKKVRIIEAAEFVIEVKKLLSGEEVKIETLVNIANPIPPIEKRA